MAGASAPVAIVTGAARGIGFAAAAELARRGYRIGLADLPGPELDRAAEQIEALGVAALALPGDVASYEAVQAAAAGLIAAWRRVDVLVNNAGISQPKTLRDISEAEWDRTVAVNLKGCFNWSKAVCETMLAAGAGRIINISSVSAHTGAGPAAVSKFAYCAAKAGILGMTRGLAKELAPNITVNAICPGSIETKLTEQLIASRREAILETIPLRRIGTPEDVAVVVAFLATVEPNYLTGEVIDVDGGQWIN